MPASGAGVRGGAGQGFLVGSRDARVPHVVTGASAMRVFSVVCQGVRHATGLGSRDGSRRLRNSVTEGARGTVRKERRTREAIDGILPGGTRCADEGGDGTPERRHVHLSVRCLH